MDDYDFSADDDGMEDPEDREDREFWQLAGSLMTPHPNECLVCFLMRAVSGLEDQGS